ncbi:MAG: GNAT family N-acetyltransferase [Chitinophagaceae bacterium]
MQFLLSNGQSLKIRPAVMGDAPQLLETFRQLVLQTDFLLTTPQEARQLTLKAEQDFISSFVHHTNNLLLLGLVGDQVVSTLTVSQGRWKKQQHLGEFGIAVLESHWNLGIARRMINYMLRWVRDQEPLTLLYCKVMANNEKAIHLYKNFGFTEQGRLQGAICQNADQYVDILFFSKKLP